MYLLLGMIRFTLWLVSGGFSTVEAEPAFGPVEGLALAVLPQIGQTRSSRVEWLRVRPAPERFGVPPGRYRVVPAFDPDRGADRRGSTGWGGLPFSPPWASTGPV